MAVMQRPCDGRTCAVAVVVHDDAHAPLAGRQACAKESSARRKPIGQSLQGPWGRRRPVGPRALQPSCERKACGLSPYTRAMEGWRSSAIISASCGRGGVGCCGGRTRLAGHLHKTPRPGCEPPLPLGALHTARGLEDQRCCAANRRHSLAGRRRSSKHRTSRRCVSSSALTCLACSSLTATRVECHLPAMAFTPRATIVGRVRLTTRHSGHD